MNGEACPVPSEPRESEQQIIRRLIGARRIAVVGLSDDPSRPSYGVASYLLGVGKEIIPVNPNETEVLGEPLDRCTMLGERIAVCNPDDNRSERSVGPSRWREHGGNERITLRIA